ncbi:MAG TPA: hypothetical protein VGS19_10070 [Streptosporangiaceae bacterium]|nr:hypothetical protein [Streptosporangiaceae bacterium]
MTSNGMHQLVSVVEITEHGAQEAPEPPEPVLAAIRTAVRGHLDLLGHESGPAVTDVTIIGEAVRVIDCRPGS